MISAYVYFLPLMFLLFVYATKSVYISGKGVKAELNSICLEWKLKQRE